MSLNIYKYHKEPSQLAGFEKHTSQLNTVDKAVFLSVNPSLLQTHPRLFDDVIEQVKDALYFAISGNYDHLLYFIDDVLFESNQNIDGFGNYFKDKLKQLSISNLHGIHFTRIIKFFGVPIEYYKDAEKLYHILETTSRFTDMVSPKYFHDIQRAVNIVWNKREFSIFDITPYIKDSPEMIKYITPEMKAEITDQFDKNMLREVGVDI